MNERPNADPPDCEDCRLHTSSPISCIMPFSRGEKNDKKSLGLMTLYIFDLDDTLIQYTRRGPNVPRQTFHALRALCQAGHECVVVTWNPFGSSLVVQTGLKK